jgi:glycosyltransferase involved in cell wall biosynthesis
MPCVSVIIPTSNRAAYLEAAIRSVLDQTFDDREIIVVDDGSSDRTPAMLEQYRGRVVYIQQEHCGLSGVTRNRGIREAAGAYIALLDPDDLWLRDKLELQLAYAARHPEYGLISCDAWYFSDDTGEDLYRFYEVTTARSGWIGPELLQECFLQTPSTLIKREVLHDVGLFSESPAFRLGDDWDLWLRIAARYQVGILDEPLVRVRFHAGNMSRQADVLQNHEHSLALIEGACARAPDVYAPVRQGAIRHCGIDVEPAPAGACGILNR